MRPCLRRRSRRSCCRGLPSSTSRRSRRRAARLGSRSSMGTSRSCPTPTSASAPPSARSSRLGTPIIPAAVGVDIGCGVIAVETDLRSEHLPDSLDPLLRQIERRIPAGVGQGHDARTAAAERWFTEHHPKRWRRDPLTPKQERRAVEQFGTLGAGNHHVEVCLDERDIVWAELHSGSRGIGNQLATMHIDRARKSAGKDGIHLEDRDLAYFREGTTGLRRLRRRHALGPGLRPCESRADDGRPARVALRLRQARAPRLGRINCHHNYSARERHEGRELWITRKGAIRARADDQGVIPGRWQPAHTSCAGRGNPASYDSSAHGAGRRHSRRQAKKRFTVEQLERHMTGKAWNRDRADALLDEIPDAYKDVESVMDDQRDLVAVEHVLHQILNYKGSYKTVGTVHCSWSGEYRCLRTNEPPNAATGARPVG